MFLDFFFLLRDSQLKVTTHEWLLLLRALQEGHGNSSLTGFYFLCRSICIKTETQYDDYDQCFFHHFKGVTPPKAVKEELLDWLRHSQPPEWFKKQISKFKSMDIEKMRREFEKRLEEQKKRHNGGNHWIGTGGTSPFGNSGHHPNGIRVGGHSLNRTASQIASNRAFKDLSKDRILDTRSISIALKKLNRLGRSGPKSELEIEETISATAKNLGDIELVYRKEKKNHLKLLMLMDIGGSMTEHTILCERLFSAANSLSHFKRFRYYFFHNCPYDYLFKSLQENKIIRTQELLQELDSSWRLIMIGDAAMNPYELTTPGGCIDYFHYNEEAGLSWLRKIRSTFPKSVWLNPIDPKLWNIPSNILVRNEFPAMFPLTIEGITNATNILNQ